MSRRNCSADSTRRVLSTLARRKSNSGVPIYYANTINNLNLTEAASGTTIIF